MGPGERAVAPERAPEPPRRAFPELRALTRGLNHSRRPAATLLCAQPSASAPSLAACFAPCGSAGPHPVKLTPTDS